MARRLKILISAYACSPVRGSEPGVGWGFVKALAEHHDLWVITEKEKFQKEIEKYLQNDPKLAARVKFHFIQKKRNRPLRKIWPPSYYWYYKQWHRRAHHKAAQLHNEIHFDVAHQLTMVGFREPGYLWQLNIPFVWGPVGGLGYFPYQFLTTVGLKGSLYYLGYNIFNFLQSHLSHRPKKAAQAANHCLITATPENQKEVLKNWKCNSIVMSEVGLPGTISTKISFRKKSEPLKLVWTGLHTPRKALNLALRGLSNLSPTVNWELNILGAGERTKLWKSYAQRLKISDRCSFHGWLPRKEALESMDNGHILLITSLRDLTSTVTIEALALGLPVICLDHCGFSHVITSECGIKIPVTTPDKVVTDIADAITKFWDNETFRRKLAYGALQRAHDFAWHIKAKQISDLYFDAVKEK